MCVLSLNDLTCINQCLEESLAHLITTTIIISLHCHLFLLLVSNDKYQQLVLIFPL